MIEAGDLERAIVGGVMILPERLSSVRSVLDPSDFGDPQARAAYEGILECADAGIAIDLLTVVEACRGKLPAAAVSSMLDYGDPINSLADYVTLVKERSVGRSVSRIDPKMQVREAGVGGLGDRLQAMAGELSAYAAQVQPAKDRSTEEIMEAIGQGIEIGPKSDGSSLTGLSTGFPSLNRLTGGFADGELVIVAARTGIGKTSFALNVATSMALFAGHAVAFYSIEMSSTALMIRVLSSHADVDSQKIRQRRVNEFEKLRVEASREKLARMPFYVSDRPAWSVERIDAHADQTPLPPRAIFVDYIQLMSSVGRHENRVQQISAVTRSLKALAVKRNVPVIAMSQLRRTESQDAEPMLSDLRESGSIEQDADMVLFLHRPYTTEAGRSGATDLVVAKQRNGPLGKIGLRFNFSTTTFSDRVQPSGDGVM